ncbi:MAG: esterase family protein [Bacteroidaceae bacterium]|nr:esterase family protein [Bacteroidaceae bacterium]
MRRFFCSLFCAAVLTGCKADAKPLQPASASTAAEAARDTTAADTSQVHYVTIHSDILNADREYTVYLPAGFDADTTRRYPILYLLHGMLDDNRCWVVRGGLKQVADELIASGKAAPMVIVTPLAGGEANKDWNGYFNMPGWAYEDFFFKEFMPLVESRFRALGDREHRAVAGLSMGGGAATSYAQRYPQLFSSCYAMSALMDKAKLPGQQAGPRSKVGLFTASVERLCTSRFVDRADEAVREQLRTVRWYVDCGDRDFLLATNKAFVAAMQRADIPLKVQYRPGQHSWKYWHTGLYICLPFVSEGWGGKQTNNDYEKQR